MSLRTFAEQALWNTRWQAEKTRAEVLYKEEWNLLRSIIVRSAVVYGHERRIVTRSGEKNTWLLDFRNVFLDPQFLAVVVDIFWKMFEKEYPFQVGGQEVASIPLIAGIVHKSFEIGKPVSGFIIRKARKPVGLQKRIEGTLDATKVILVDDLINSGSTIIRQVLLLEGYQKLVHAVFVVCTFRKPAEYDFLREKKIQLASLFSLEDIGLQIGGKKDSAPREIFDVRWKFSSDSPDYLNIVQKSTPCLEGGFLYVGSDKGEFFALRQKDNSIAWKYRAEHSVRQGDGFTSPIKRGERIYVTLRSGVCYALDAASGVCMWNQYLGGKCGGSVMATAAGERVFVGTNNKRLRNKGKLVALASSNGDSIWAIEVPGILNCSPVYIENVDMVVVCDSLGNIFAVQGESGEIIWKKSVPGSCSSDVVYDAHSDQIFVGATNGRLFVLPLHEEAAYMTYATYGAITAPVSIEGDYAYVLSHDGHVYCIDLVRQLTRWKLYITGIPYAAALLHEDKIFVGTDAGIVYEISSQTGKINGVFYTEERIMNPIKRIEDSDDIIVTTHANEIYRLSRRH